MKRHIVLIGDLVGSKELGYKERKKFQAILTDKISQLNKESDSIISPLTITLGDEFQAVYKNMSALLADSWSILTALHPVGVRFSVGIGEIYTPLNTEQTLGMDGPAFHSARDGMDQVKKSGGTYCVKLGSSKNQSDAAQSLVSLVNYSLMFLSNEMGNWKVTRLQVLTMLDDGLSIKEIAEEIGISESAVYKNREDGNLKLILELKEGIGENIKQIQ